MSTKQQEQEQDGDFVMVEVALSPTVSDRMPLKGYNEKIWVQFQQPRNADLEAFRVAQVSERIVTEERPDGSRVVTTTSRPTLSAIETTGIMYCLVACNAMDPATKLLIFDPGRTCRAPGPKPLPGNVALAFEGMWAVIPPEMAVAIRDALLAAFPIFNLRVG